MIELSDKDKKKNLMDLVIQKQREGKVVLMTFEGLISCTLEGLINQPAEGLLYDLNRLPETVMTFIDDSKWINDYAVGLVITKLKTDNERLRKENDALRASPSMSVLRRLDIQLKEEGDE